MLRWVQEGLSVVAGVAEPEYGPEALHSIVDRGKPNNPFSALTRKDLCWKNPPFTNVETQTFYFTGSEGHIIFAQVIHSNVAGLHTTAQFTCRVYHPTKPEDCIWISQNLSDFKITDDDDTESREAVSFAEGGTSGASCQSDNGKLKITLSKDLSFYHFLSNVHEDLQLDVIVKRECEGFKIYPDGTTLYGTNPEEPWGSMRHLFWPRSSVQGKIVIKSKEIALSGHCMYVMALQGMKPHHAAAHWNFANFQGPTVSAVMMEFTTPPSYGSTRVNIGGLTQGDKLVAATVDNTAEHSETTLDDFSQWSIPTKLNLHWQGYPTDQTEISGEPTVEATINASLDNLIEKVDVMSEIPMFVKKVVSGVAGTRPYIFQYCNPAEISLKTPEGTVTERGTLYSEATFIS
ncbi:hypothetical protein CANCADRAFT_32537 [Tortispora caseinolytica NRRL Y-17796]|uniref:Survival factor 1 n=1 Tax=Tortispora caseinolytica NRRL Y-17796 TaxID=767744 RepID=A0A1E4TBS5_9ASCO|nr:hypothetical protein CANCADRAFT_32537 [Tortispora caseinolytica NRRL Y-17796]